MLALDVTRLFQPYNFELIKSFTEYDKQSICKCFLKDLQYVWRKMTIVRNTSLPTRLGSLLW